LGFNRLGPDGECFECVTIQRSLRTYEERQFTIEVGVYVPKIQELLLPELVEQVKFPHAWDATFRERLPILAGWKDHWWPSDRTGDLTEISLLLERAGFPFLERWNTLERIFASYQQGLDRDKIRDGLATCILYLSGKPNEAREKLLHIQADSQKRAVGIGYAERLAARLKIEL
jgi:hypothetical protein